MAKAVTILREMWDIRNDDGLNGGVDRELLLSCSGAYSTTATI